MAKGQVGDKMAEKNNTTHPYLNEEGGGREEGVLYNKYKPF